MGFDRRSNWRALVAEYRAGGEGKSIFCRRHGIKLSTLKYWLYEKDKDKPKQEAQFLPVVEQDKNEREIKTELIISGARLIFNGTPPASYLAQLLSGLS